jgi:hypothetical protein
VHLGLLISLPFVEVRMQPKGSHHPAVPHHHDSAQNRINKCLNADGEYPKVSADTHSRRRAMG